MIRSLIIDWKQTLYDPDSDSLIDGSQALLDYIHDRDLPLYLVGKGDAAMYQAAERLGVTDYFEDVVFVGTEKLPEHFQAYIDQATAATTLVKRN